MFRNNDKIHEIKIINSSNINELRFIRGKYAIRDKNIIIAAIIKNVNNFTIEGSTTVDIFTVDNRLDINNESKWKLWQSIPRHWCSLVYDVM